MIRNADEPRSRAVLLRELDLEDFGAAILNIGDLAGNLWGDDRQEALVTNGRYLRIYANGAARPRRSQYNMTGYTGQSA